MLDNMEIGKKLIETVSGKIIDKYDPKGIDYIPTESSQQNKIEECISKFQEEFVSKYGDELYYSNLDAYISNNNLLNNLIDNFRNFTGQVAKSEFAEQHTARFVERYNIYSSISSTIKDFFTWMFEYIFALSNYINPDSDFGRLLKIQSAINSENAYNNYCQSTKMNAQFSDINYKLDMICDAIFCNSANDRNGIESSDNSDKLNDIFTKIDKIEQEHQKKHEFTTALEKYMGLFQEITPQIRNYSKQQADEILCVLNCNIALCYFNLENVNEAVKSLQQINADAANNSKKYNFVYAVVIAEGKHEYDEAIFHLNRALEIDKDYHKAFLLRQQLYAIVKKQSYEENIRCFNKKLDKIGEDRQLKADYYLYRGLINLAYHKTQDAVCDFRMAEKFGYDEVIVNLNCCSAMYQEMTSKFSADGNIEFFVNIDFSIANAIIATLKPIAKNKDTLAKLNFTVTNNIMKLYLSTCSMAGVDNELSAVSDYLGLCKDEETKRLLLLNSKEMLDEKELECLDEEEKLYLDLIWLMNKGNVCECKEKILGIMNDKNTCKPAYLTSILLQACITTKDSKTYWEFRKKVSDNLNNKNFLLSMDAYMYDDEGDIQKAKSIFDELVLKSKDSIILENATKFYTRNNFNEDAEKNIFRIIELNKRSEICINDIGEFYMFAISFFISIKSDRAFEILEEANSEKIDRKVYIKMQANLYIAVNDLGKLSVCMEELYEMDNSLSTGLNMAICKYQLMEYEKCIEICDMLIEKAEQTEQLVKLYWLKSDSYLMMNDLDNSYVWAEKTHQLKKDIPTDESHQAFFARSMRCRQYEGMAEMSEYQKTHPVVVDYFKTLTIEPDKNILDTLTSALDEYAPNRGDLEKEQKEFEILYRNNPIPISILLKRFNGDWRELFQFAEKNKLNIFGGDREQQYTEMRKINKDIVVDVYTLVILSYYQVLQLLEYVEHIYVSYSTITALQCDYLRFGYKFIEEVLLFIKTKENIIIEYDGFADEKDRLSEIMSVHFINNCNVAKRKNIPFVYSDMISNILKNCNESEMLKNIEMVSIPALCSFVEEKDVKAKELSLYKIMSGTAFISFSANTILTVIEENSDDALTEIIKPFMNCKSDYDMQSYQIVYLNAINKLKGINPKIATEFAEIVLKNAEKLWRKGTLYRRFKNVDADAKIRSMKIFQYAYGLVCEIEKIYNDKEDSILEMCENIKHQIVEYYV